MEAAAVLAYNSKTAKGQPTVAIEEVSTQIFQKYYTKYRLNISLFFLLRL